tara:strand:+ start:2761 stop:3204 length:444 start_codon:yes stop_codon:yes gene_type:complete
MIKCILINSIKNDYVPEVSLFEKWVSALEYADNAEITIKITTEEEMRNYNMLYRNQDKVSDTLSFPSDNLKIDNKIILGDIVMCANKINSDSYIFKKDKNERWAHLTIHSVLHILGYNHDNLNNQKNMEKKEIDILKKFNIFNPYEI